jgi:hypothetical protein
MLPIFLKISLWPQLILCGILIVSSALATENNPPKISSNESFSLVKNTKIFKLQEKLPEIDKNSIEKFGKKNAKYEECSKYILKGEFPRARTYIDVIMLEEEEKEAPTCESYYFLGIIYFKLNESQLACENFANAVDLEPDMINDMQRYIDYLNCPTFGSQRRHATLTKN